MYSIGTILKINMQACGHPGGIYTGLVVGYSFRDGAARNVILWYRETSEDGIFGVDCITTSELAARSEVCGKCDISSFIDTAEHLKHASEFLNKREDNLQEVLDSIHQNQRELEKQMESSSD